MFCDFFKYTVSCRFLFQYRAMSSTLHAPWLQGAALLRVRATCWWTWSGVRCQPREACQGPSGWCWHLVGLNSCSPVPLFPSPGSPSPRRKDRASGEGVSKQATAPFVGSSAPSPLSDTSEDKPWLILTVYILTFVPKWKLGNTSTYTWLMPFQALTC